MVVLGTGGIFILAAGVFAASALLVRRPDCRAASAHRAVACGMKLTRGPRCSSRSRSFRAVIALDVVVALATAMVMVNTVVIVQGVFDLQRDASALAFFAFGLGAILARFCFRWCCRLSRTSA